MLVFFKEYKLILTTNLARSYYHECFVRGIVKTFNCLQDLIFEYGKINLYDDDKKNQIYNKLLEKHPFENSQIYQSISILMLHVLDHKLVMLIQTIGYMMLVIF
jgi:hypothetical protein